METYMCEVRSNTYIYSQKYRFANKYRVAFLPYSATGKLFFAIKDFKNFSNSLGLRKQGSQCFLKPGPSDWLDF